MKIIIVLLLLSSLSQANTSVKALPKPVQVLQQMLVRQGECETRWPEMAGKDGVIRSQLERDMVLYLVPCAQWDRNLAWTAYVTILEPKHPDGFLTKSIRFVDYSVYKGLVAQDYAYNIYWNDKTKTLTARFFHNGKDVCGSQSQFRWDSGQQTLILNRMIMQDKNCESNGGSWANVVKPKPLTFFENMDFSNLKEVFENSKLLDHANTKGL